jgi:hypothetical protein
MVSLHTVLVYQTMLHSFQRIEMAQFQSKLQGFGHNFTEFQGRQLRNTI